MENTYEFFQKEYQEYEKNLLKYKNDNTQVFFDQNFHPNKQIEELEISINAGNGQKIKLFDESIEWVRIDEIYEAPLFDKEKIHPLFIKQGNIGDCYFITALTRIAKKSDIVQTLFEKELPDQILGPVENSLNLKSGAVVVYFRVFGRRTPVLIDTRVPCIRDSLRRPCPVFSSSLKKNISPWFCLVEKAFAKLNGSYSNITGGFFCESFYSLYGYYNKIYNFTTDTAKNTQKILKYQMDACLMDTSIKSQPQDKIEAAKKVNLYSDHSYLLTKVRQYDDIIFFLLRNPWGNGEWTGSYCKYKNELKKFLEKDRKEGQFWIPEDVYYDFFTRVDVAKPISTFWTIRFFEFKIPTSSDNGSKRLKQQRTFVFKLNDDIPTGHKARVRILVEKRIRDYKYLRLKGSCIYVYLGRNGGKKLDKSEISSWSFNSIAISTKLKGKDDIISFAIVHESPKNVEADCYVNVFCEFNFTLYDIDDPERQFPMGDTIGAVFDNFSFSEPNSAKPLVKYVKNGVEGMWRGDPIMMNFKKGLNDPNEKIIIKNIIKETKRSQNRINEKQINLKKFIFNNELIVQGNKSEVYLITESKTGEEFAAIVSFGSIENENVREKFYEKVSIMMKLKHPSIVNFIGFSEIDFTKRPNPMIITDYFPRGNLLDAIENDLDELTNTKKMIILIGVAFAMKYIHSNNIILLHLPCSSILLDDNLYPKIANFNLARLDVPNKEKLRSDSLPYYFLAPEIVDGSKQYSKKCDVFAFGMLYYHVVSGTEPTIKHNNKKDFFCKIMKGEERPSLDEIDERHCQFIESLWNKDPEKRPTLDWIIDNLLHNKYECWLKGVDKNNSEIKQYIQQFDAKL